MPDTTLPGRATYEQYRQFPGDGKGYEILDGKVYVIPAPSPEHQYASRQLQRILERCFEREANCVVFDAPLDVILAEDDIVQPDIVVVQRSQISKRGVEGAPLLIVEALSPSNVAFDRTATAERYRVRGVPHYWLLDPESRTLERFRLDEVVYRPTLPGRTAAQCEFPRSMASQSSSTDSGSRVPETRRAPPLPAGLKRAIWSSMRRCSST